MIILNHGKEECDQVQAPRLPLCQRHKSLLLTKRISKAAQMLQCPPLKFTARFLSIFVEFIKHNDLLTSRKILWLEMPKMCTYRKFTGGGGVSFEACWSSVFFSSLKFFKLVLPLLIHITYHSSVVSPFKSLSTLLYCCTFDINENTLSKCWKTACLHRYVDDMEWMCFTKSVYVVRILFIINWGLVSKNLIRSA